MVFTPDQFGKFKYEFLKLADSNYEDIDIKAVSKQTVHPLASVRFTKAGRDEKVWSCEGDSIETEVELKVRLFAFRLLLLALHVINSFGLSGSGSVVV
jgi:hypothetical protein